MARATRTSEDEPNKALPPEPEVEAKGNGAVEDDEFAADDAIPSPELGDISDLQAFAADDNDIAIDDAETLYCSTGRPESDAYIRTYPDTTWWKDLWIVEHTGADNRKTTYLVHKSLRKLEELEGKVKRKCAVPYITLTGGLGLWLIGADFGDNPWVASAMRCCRRAIDEWIMPVSRREIGQNKARPANGQHPDPIWPKLDFWQMVDLAFQPERRITPANYRDHPVLKKFRGE
jgi:hypothetical protein